MEAAAAADLAVDVAAHRTVILAAREQHEAVRALAILSATAGEATDKTCAQVELEAAEIAGLQEKYKVAADAVGPGGLTPLLLACMQGKAGDVTALLALGADPAIEGDLSTISFPEKKYRCTPLMLAVRDGLNAIMTVLLAHELVDVNQASSDVGRTSLMFACVSGHAAIVKLLLAHDGIDANQARTDTGITPLLVACGKGHVEIVVLLLAHDGIDVNQAAPNTGITPLLVACGKGHVEIVALLLAHDGIDVNQATTDTGATPLYLSCQEGYVEVVTLMLSHAGVDANQATTVDGTTPLFVACRKGFVEIVKLLLVHKGIGANQAANEGTTPLIIACEEGHVEAIKLMLAHVEIDVNKARTDTGESPLYVACFGGYAAVVKLLLAHGGINVNEARTDTGMTPLFMACAKGHVEIVKLLLAHNGMDVNKATAIDGFDGLTPLLGAVFGGVLLTTQYLVLYGASVALEDSGGTTPAQFASSQNMPELTEWLNAVSSWSQLRVAAGCRLYKDAAFLLRRGKIDPDDPATTSIKDIMALVATSTAKPAALPWRDAPQICKATTKLVADATRGWHRTTHWLHHKAVRDAVFAVLVVTGRLQEKGAVPVEASSDVCCADVGTAEARAPMPLLPIELWLFAMRFFMRSWWGVEGVTA